MKINLLYTATIFLAVSCKTIAIHERSVPETGVTILGNGSYFIVNAASGRALTPNVPSSGQNVFLRAFSRSGAQKWVLNIQGKNASISLCGYEDLFFQPHPSVSDRTPVISPEFRGESSIQFHIERTGRPGLWIIKSVKLNNDALRAMQGGEELRFSSPSVSDSRQLWKLIQADCR